MKKYLLLVSLLATPLLAQNSYTNGTLAVSCSAVTSVQVCTQFAIPQIHDSYPSAFTWQIITTGAPATISITFEGSIDGVTWATLDTSTATAGEQRSFTGKAARFTRCNLGTLTGGTAPTVTCQFMVTHGAGGVASGGGAPTGAAGGDLGGTYPNPTVTKATNGFTLTAGQMIVPSVSCVTPSLVVAGSLTTGFFGNAANTIQMCASGALVAGVKAGAVATISTSGYGISSSTSNLTTLDVKMIRLDSGILGISDNTGTAPVSFLASGGQKTIKGGNGGSALNTGIATTTLTTITDGTTPWTFTFPATTTARTYNYACEITYQGSATTTSLVLGVVESVATGAGTLLNNARIDSTTNGSAFTSASQNSTPVAATSITTLTGAVVGTANANTLAKIWGSVDTTTATSTLSIQAAASPSGTVLIMRGSSCQAFAQ